MKLFHTLHDALEAHLPTVADENERLEGLTYLRGLKTVLATVVVPDAEDNVIHLEDHLLQRRIAKAISEKRHAQLADAKVLGDHYVADDFGWPEHDDID